uniref:F-box domain-containing protein n=1 Tax=Mycena chlorophos TaxID=658473 RepID=A0ABQ0M1I9_MYCCL|nr:predicted protein [Mycena chlorophos]
MTRLLAHCALTGQDPCMAGPTDFTWDDEESFAELAKEMADEILTSASSDVPDTEIRAILQEALAEYSGSNWLEAHTGRCQPEDAATDENFYRTCIVIEPSAAYYSGEHGEVRFTSALVEDYSYDARGWKTLVVDGQRVNSETRCYDSQVLCWERPWKYFRHWLQQSSEKLAALDEQTFLKTFFMFICTDHGECNHKYGLPCISYGQIENVRAQQAEWVFYPMRTGVKHTALAIAAGARSSALWPAMAKDFNVWETTRPDIWPVLSSIAVRSQPNAALATTSVFDKLPTELLLQILISIPRGDLLKMMVLSRGVFLLLSQLLDEVLWHHVHYGDLHWLLPVPSVPGDVERAAGIIAGSTDRTRMDSREFPFAAYLPLCSASDSMRNRARLWNIAQQFRIQLEIAIGRSLL